MINFSTKTKGEDSFEVTNNGFARSTPDIGHLNDTYEKEACAVADQAMMRPNPDTGQVQMKPISEISDVSMECTGCEKEASLQMKPEIQKSGDGLTYPSTDFASQLQSSSGQGQALPDRVSNELGSKIGADFSNVRIHTGSQAIHMSREIGAQAFTYGQDIYFNEGKYDPGSSQGKHLIAHELAHVVQQVQPSGCQGEVIQRQESQETNDPRLQEIIEKLREGGELTEEELNYVEQHISQEIIRQILGSMGQIGIEYDPDREPEDIDRNYQGALELKLTGLAGAMANSFEGTATADINLHASVENERAILTIQPPTGENRMAAVIRQQFFYNNNPRTFDFEFSRNYFQYANSIWLISGIRLAIVAQDATPSPGSNIVIHHESVPSGVELIITLMSSAAPAAETAPEANTASDHWLLTPNPSIFGTVGYAGYGGNNAFQGTLGVDFPLAYDSENPLLYMGLGARGSIDTNALGRVGGTAFVGVNIDPLRLQMGFGMGAAFLPESLSTPGGPAQTVLYNEAEGIAAFRVLNNMELMLLLTTGGGSELPTYGTVQTGMGYRF
ncbi:MAG: DUF4157 domain-containing protein [Bacteroidota bacterium]